MRKIASRTSLAALLAFELAALCSPRAARADDEALGRASAAVSRGDYALAEKELSSVKGGKEHTEAVLALGHLQLLTGRYEVAIATARSAAGLGKEAHNEAAAIRGEALAAQGKNAEAMAALKEVESEDGARRARVLLGELLIRSGRRADAKVPLLTLVDDYNSDKITQTDVVGLTLVGRAAHLLRSPHDANDAYKAAEKAGGKKSVETLLAGAELFLDKYDPGHAGAEVKDALKLAPRDPPAHLMMARVKLENAMDFEAAESEVRQALDVNPNLADAYFVRAGLALRDMDIAGADQAADKGLSINPSDLELYSMKAAIRFLADDKPGFEAMKKKVFALDPEFSTFYQIVGEFAEWEHRYDDIVKMMGEATAVDKNDAKAYATLGLNLIRSGDDDGGVQALKQAWQKDKFNVRVYNTLNLFEKDIPTEYVTVKGPRFNIRYHKEEKAILERYIPRMLDEAWSSMVQRYGFTPQMPVSIELYADTQAFSIRTSGLPNVGIQGVCFGKTLAALSPTAGPFNWGNVLWHELGHVFAIQMSKNHVPRWFTEGLSEYETIVRRPEWQREEDPALFAALKAGRIPPVDGFNRAFTHVDSVEDVTMAYYAASQILVFAAKEFGFPRVVSMLPRWGAGQRTAEVVKESLGITPEELDRRFHAWLTPHLERYSKQYVPDMHSPPLDDARKNARANPNDAKRQVELALALYADGQKPEGEAVLAEALRLDPKQPDAHYVKLRLAMKEKNAAEAERLIAKMIADGNDGYVVRMKAADLAEHKKDLAVEKQNLEAAHKLDPTQAEPLQGLYDLAHKANDKDGELAALSKLAMIDQHDRKVWNLLLEHLLAKGDWEEARKVGESALFIDVHNWKTHRLYAKALARTGNFVSAVYELNSALVCHPKLPKDQAEIYGELVKAYTKLKEPEMAKQAQEYQTQIEAAPAPAPGPEKKGHHGGTRDRGREPGPAPAANLLGSPAHVPLPGRPPPNPRGRRREGHTRHARGLPGHGRLRRPHGRGRSERAGRAVEGSLRSGDQRPEDAAHGRHRAPRRDRQDGARRAHRDHDRLRDGGDGDRRHEARRVRLRAQALQARRGRARRPARHREAAHGGGEPAPARGGLALQGERGHRREPLARRGPRDGRRRVPQRGARRPGLHLARRRRGLALRAAAPALGRPPRRRPTSGASTPAQIGGAPPARPSSSCSSRGRRGCASSPRRRGCRSTRCWRCRCASTGG